jgi:hypothetical protein
MSADGKLPALLALVEPKWLEQAFRELINGKPAIAFRTDAQIGNADGLPIKNVYFKVTGKPEVVARADFIKVTTDNPREKRLTGHQDDEGKFYYVFRTLTSLPPTSLSLLRFFKTGTTVPNEQPGACIIEELG